MIALWSSSWKEKGFQFVAKERKRVRFVALFYFSKSHRTAWGFTASSASTVSPRWGTTWEPLPLHGEQKPLSQNRHSLSWRMDSGARPAVSAAPGNSMTLPPFTLYRSKPSAWCQPLCLSSVQFSLSRGQHFVTQWTAACQASLFITNSWRLCKLMAIESKMPSNHLILCHPLPLPPSIFLSSRIFSNKSVLRITWPKHWSFSIIFPMNTQGWFPLGWTGSISLLAKGLPRVFSNTTV